MIEKQLKNIKGNISSVSTAINFGRGGSSKKYIQEK